MDTVGHVLFFCLFVAMVFIFQGEPDLFDKWQIAAHAHADGMAECTNE